MRGRKMVSWFWSAVVVFAITVHCVIVVRATRDSIREEVVRCLRAPDAESAAMACPQWMQEARR